MKPLPLKLGKDYTGTASSCIGSCEDVKFCFVLYCPPQSLEAVDWRGC